MAGSSELWVQCFTCCMTQRPARTRNGRSQQHQKLRIDRSMIGVPTNFRHTAHISSGDVDMSIAQLANLQAQMQRKGGYDTNIGAKVCSRFETVEVPKFLV
ncbi:CDC42 small effector protein-like protein [Harpegnathos saltator]|uniref:CDC42 small effector protein-like protein n=1 Tax=Harpegnathos saltator TaxID=610380 RepID=E2C2U4_HARSA|nr:CDC42 small effector protein-like protein [Harpegnathos saltator]